MNPLIQVKKATPVFVFGLVLACFALSPTVRAVLPSPTPDGGYTGWNTAEGQNALFNLTTGGFNTAIGGHALFGDTTGAANTAVGAFALGANSSGVQNVAIGQGALRSNTIGTGNTAVGFQAAKLMGGPMNDNNTAIGFAALDMLTHGNSNTAIGANALDAISRGGQNIAVGSFAGGFLNSGDNNIDIGNSGFGNDSNTIRIGDPAFQTATYIAGISGATVPSGVTVIVGSDGHLGTIVSSARFKDEIKPMDKVSEAILALRPVTFRYKQQLDPEGIPQFGLVAEEVEKVNPDLVARDAQGKPYTVRYDQVNAMLLNEFLKEHKKTEKLEATVASLIATVKEQAAQIQKVRAQVEASKATPQVVNNP
jgi:hypothetical protein